jgi:hypothetical protein
MAVIVDTELTLADMDTGGGTADRAVVGIFVPGSGGPVLAPGDGTLGFKLQLSSILSAASTTDTVAASFRTDAISNNLTELTPKFVFIDGATSGDNTLVSAVSSKKIRVHQLFIVNTTALTVRFESGAGGTALTGQMNVAANGGFVLPFSPMGWFETAATTLLNMELSGATSVDGVLGYTEV